MEGDQETQDLASILGSKPRDAGDTPSADQGGAEGAKGEDADTGAKGGDAGGGQAGGGAQGGGSLGQAAADPKETPITNFGAILGDTFKDYTTDRLKSELEEGRKARELLGAEPYKSPIAKAMDELLSTGVAPETALKYINTDEKTMSDKELLVLKMQIDDPTMPIDRIERYIERKYKIGKEAANEEAEKDGLDDLKMDMRTVREQFSTVKEKMLQQGQSRDTVAGVHKEADRAKAWAPHVDKLSTKLKTLELPIGVDKETGKPLKTVNFALSDDTKVNEMINHIINNNKGWNADDKGIATVEQVAKSVLLAEHLPKILQTVYAKGRSEASLELGKEWNNIDLGGDKNKNSLDNGAAAQDKGNAFLNQVEKSYGY